MSVPESSVRIHFSRLAKPLFEQEGEVPESVYFHFLSAKVPGMYPPPPPDVFQTRIDRYVDSLPFHKAFYYEVAGKATGRMYGVIIRKEKDSELLVLVGLPSEIEEKVLSQDSSVERISLQGNN